MEAKQAGLKEVTAKFDWSCKAYELPSLES